MNKQYCSITTAGLFLLAFLALTLSLSAQVGTEGVDSGGRHGFFRRGSGRGRGYGGELGDQPDEESHHRFPGKL